jgi:hypothetical protein
VECNGTIPHLAPIHVFGWAKQVERNSSRKPNIRSRSGTRPFHRFGGIYTFPCRRASLSPGKKGKIHSPPLARNPIRLARPLAPNPTAPHLSILAGGARLQAGDGCESTRRASVARVAGERRRQARRRASAAWLAGGRRIPGRTADDGG